MLTSTHRADWNCPFVAGDIVESPRGRAVVVGFDGFDDEDGEYMVLFDFGSQRRYCFIEGQLSKI